MKLSLRGLLAYAQRHRIRTTDELQRQTGCCSGCGSCRAYIDEMLRTGVVPRCEDIPRITDISHLYPPE